MGRCRQSRRIHKYGMRARQGKERAVRMLPLGRVELPLLPLYRPGGRDLPFCEDVRREGGLLEKEAGCAASGPEGRKSEESAGVGIIGYEIK